MEEQAVKVVRKRGGKAAPPLVLSDKQKNAIIELAADANSLERIAMLACIPYPQFRRECVDLVNIGRAKMMAPIKAAYLSMAGSGNHERVTLQAMAAFGGFAPGEFTPLKEKEADVTQNLTLSTTYLIVQKARSAGWSDNEIELYANDGVIPEGKQLPKMD